MTALNNEERIILWFIHCVAFFKLYLKKIKVIKAEQRETAPKLQTMH